MGDSPPSAWLSIMDAVSFSCLLVAIEEVGRSLVPNGGPTMPWAWRITFALVGIASSFLGRKGATIWHSLGDWITRKSLRNENAELRSRLMALEKRDAEPHLSEEYYSLRSENDRLKIKLKEQRATDDARTNLLLENAKLKREIAQMKAIPTDQNVPALMPSPERILLPKPEDRIFINESPAFLLRFFDDHHTAVQAQALLKPCLRNWMKLPRIQISDIEDSSFGGYSVRGTTQDGATVIRKHPVNPMVRRAVAPWGSPDAYVCCIGWRIVLFSSLEVARESRRRPPVNSAHCLRESCLFLCPLFGLKQLPQQASVWSSCAVKSHNDLCNVLDRVEVSGDRPAP